MSIYTADPFTQGVYIAALFGLTFGWGIFTAIDDPTGGFKTYAKYTLATPVLFGGFVVGGAVFGSGSLHAALLAVAGMVAWNAVQYYLFPGAVLALLSVGFRAHDLLRGETPA